MSAPEPKAPASDLDAAVSEAEREWERAYGLDHGTVSVRLATMRTILKALSAQSQAAEGMAKALIETVEHFERVDGDERHKAVIANATAAYAHYRTLGDRHDD